MLVATPASTDGLARTRPAADRGAAIGTVSVTATNRFVRIVKKPENTIRPIAAVLPLAAESRSDSTSWSTSANQVSAARLAAIGGRSAERGRVRVERDFPEVAVGILKVAGVAAVEGLLRRLHDRGAGLPGLLDQRVDLGLGADVVRERELGRAARTNGKPGVLGQAPPRPQPQGQSSLQL